MPEPETPPVPALRQPDPTLDRLARLGQWLAATEAGQQDEKSRGAAAALRFYYAEQLDLPAPAVAELTVINGRLFVGAQLLRALAERNGYRVIRKESTAEKCVAELIDAHSKEVFGTATFTIEDAQRAGLIRDRSPWKTHPARMLWARASKNVIVDFAPAVALGISTIDEIPEYTRDSNYDVEAEGVEWPDEPMPDEPDVTAQVDDEGTLHVRQKLAVDPAA